MRNLPKEIHFAAVVHFDPKGYTKLVRLLDKIKPSHVFVELSPWGLMLRKQYSRFLLGRLRENLRQAASALKVKYTETLKHPSIQSIIAKISIPYEYRAAFKYSMKSGTGISLVDSSLYSITHTADWKHLISTTNLISLLGQELPSLRAHVAFEYRLAREILNIQKSESGMNFHPTEDIREREREEWLFLQLKLQLGIFEPEKSLYVGGWKHFIPSTTFMKNLRRITATGTRVLILSDPTTEVIIP